MSPLMKALARREAMINIDNSTIDALAKTGEDLPIFEDVSNPPALVPLETKEEENPINKQDFPPPVETKVIAQTKTQGGRKPTYDVEKFIAVFTEVCHNGGTPAEVAEKMGMNLDQVSQRATQLRKKGYNVPQFKRGPKTK